MKVDVQQCYHISLFKFVHWQEKNLKGWIVFKVQNMILLGTIPFKDECKVEGEMYVNYGCVT